MGYENNLGGAGPMEPNQEGSEGSPEILRRAAEELYASEVQAVNPSIRSKVESDLAKIDSPENDPESNARKAVYLAKMYANQGPFVDVVPALEMTILPSEQKWVILAEAYEKMADRFLKGRHIKDLPKGVPLDILKRGLDNDTKEKRQKLADPYLKKAAILRRGLGIK